MFSFCAMFAEKWHLKSPSISMNFPAPLWSNGGYSRQGRICRWSSLLGHDPSLLNFHCQIQWNLYGALKGQASLPLARTDRNQESSQEAEAQQAQKGQMLCKVWRTQASSVIGPKASKMTSRRASQQRSSITAYPLMVMLCNPMLVPCYSPIPSWKGALRIGTSASWATTLPRQARNTNMALRHARVPTLAPKQVLLPTPTGKGAKPNKKPPTLKKPNKPFGKGTSGIKKAP